MGLFDFMKKKPKKWSELSDNEKSRVTNRLIGVIKNMSGARYKVVSGTDEWQRERGIVETKSEDEILDSSKRFKMLDLARNSIRNNATFNTILKQFDLHAVGVEGGKAIFTSDDREYSKDVLREFSHWTRNADFFDGLCLNDILKLIVKLQIVGGDLVILFDSGLINDSGKIILFESDEIGDIDKETLARVYGKDSYQSQGRVYTKFGQFQGVICSKSQRGLTVFDPKKSFMLKRDPNSDYFSDTFLMPRNIFRPNQGRGINTQTSSSLSTTIDLMDYLGYEIAAAKKNAQTLAQVLHTQKDEKTVLPSPFDSNTDFTHMTDAELEEAVKQQIGSDGGSDLVKTMTLDKIIAAGCIYQAMPDDYKIELLDTKHPNVNSIEFVRWLASMSAAPYGLTSVYATLKVDSSYTAFRGEQLMSEPAWKEVQKNLEKICDWILYQWYNWAVRKNIIEPKFEKYWIDNVSWSWPKMADVDAVKEQQAIQLRLQNLTGSYADVYGSNWREKLDQIKKEIDYCHQIGVTHPSQITVAGAIIPDQKENDSGS